MPLFSITYEILFPPSCKNVVVNSSKQEKSQKKRDFICVYHKKAVPLRRDYGYDSIY